MHASIQITNKDNNVLKIDWSDSENLKKWMAYQRTRSRWMLDKPDCEFFTEYQIWFQKYWSIIENFHGFNLPNNSKVLDIGSGIGIMDLFLSLHLSESEYFLVDKNSYRPINGNRFGNLHPFYNSFEPTVDAIKTTNLNPSRFKFIDPSDEWPTDCDLISSHYSWCWHYSVHTYLDNAYNSLNMNGKLLISVRFTDSEDAVDILNNKFGTNLQLFYLEKKDQIETEKQIFDVPGPYYGVIGLWQKTK